MSPEAPEPDEERYVELLAAADEELAAGCAPLLEQAPPELRPRLERDLTLAQLLRQALPTRGADSPGPREEPAAPAGAQLGDFEIVREIGRGGMGVVYEARQLSLNRSVALKVLSGGPGLTPAAVERFRREAEAAAGLHHTNIVPVYATGEAGGAHFYAMELIEGPALDKVIRRQREAADWRGDRGEGPWVREVEEGPPVTPSPPHPLTPSSSGGPPAGEVTNLTPPSPGSDRHHFDEVAKMIADVADALDYAHRKGVIHRDIKPSNLLLSPDGRLSVNDFGLARVLEQPGMTMAGDLVGTPAYMSPEQLTAGRVAVDHRTDIYSLGATLYELLTLQPPFLVQQRDQVLAQVLQEDPRPPRKVNGKVPADLETICLKAMDKDRDRRYQTAGQMAEDLRRFVNRFPIRARRPGPVERLRKWARRNPAPAGALLVVALAAACVGYFGYRSYSTARQAEADRVRHEDERRADRLRAALERTTLAAMAGKFDEAERDLDEAIVLGASAGDILLWRGQIALHRGNAQTALQQLEEAARLLPGSVAARAVLLRAYWDAGQFDTFYIRYPAVRNMSPQTAEDYLFLGQVTAYQDPEGGLSLLDEAIRQRDTALPRLIWAEARTNYAQVTGQPDDAERALDAVKFAGENRQGDPSVLAVSLEAHLVAAFTYERHNNPGRSRKEREKARRCADALGELPSLPPKARRMRLLFLDQVDDKEAVAAEYRREKDSNGGEVPGRVYFSQLYRQGRFAEALKVLEGMPKKGNEVIYHVRRAFVLPHLPGGVDKALAEYKKAAKLVPDGPRAGRGIYPPLILLFLGQKARATELYRQSAETWPADHWDQSGWWKTNIEYLGGKCSAEKVLEEAGDSRWRQCEAHFHIGLSLLAEGDRAAARQHFQQSVDTRVFWFLEYEWSRDFLARMKEDAAWPPWIK